VSLAGDRTPSFSTPRRAHVVGMPVCTPPLSVQERAHYVKQPSSKTRWARLFVTTVPPELTVCPAHQNVNVVQKEHIGTKLHQLVKRAINLLLRQQWVLPLAVNVQKDRLQKILRLKIWKIAVALNLIFFKKM